MLDWHGYATYNADTVSQNTPSRSGVYIVWVKQTTGDWKCRYVGQSLDLKARLLAHLSTDEPNTALKNIISRYICGFSFAEVPQVSLLNGVERYLYDHYRPECNVVQPQGSPCPVNLP